MITYKGMENFSIAFHLFELYTTILYMLISQPLHHCEVGGTNEPLDAGVS
jgi:hypothetical protein